MSDRLLCLGGPRDGEVVENDRSEWECPVPEDMRPTGVQLFGAPINLCRFRTGRYVLAEIGLECRFRGHFAVRHVWLWDEEGAGHALHKLLEDYEEAGE